MVYMIVDQTVSRHMLPHLQRQGVILCSAAQKTVSTVTTLNPKPESLNPELRKSSTLLGSRSLGTVLSKPGLPFGNLS